MKLHEQQDTGSFAASLGWNRASLELVQVCKEACCPSIQKACHCLPEKLKVSYIPPLFYFIFSHCGLSLSNLTFHIQKCGRNPALIQESGEFVAIQSHA